MKTLIIGCGYVGLPLALAYRARGHEIGAWVHSTETAEALRGHAFEKVIVGSVADDELWEELPSYDQVIHCASSGRGGAEAYREVFLEGARRMGAHQAQAQRLLVSSTSVYGQTGGESVTEESAAEPVSETSRILREAEEVALVSGSIVVRSAGIYGPGRTVLLEKQRRGEAVIEGDGVRWINQIHRDDLVAAIELLLEKGRAGEIYNLSDGAPVTYCDYYAWTSQLLGQTMPPTGPVNVNRKRGVTNKRVSNEKLRGLGWRAKFPSFKEGITSDLRQT